MSKDKSTVYRIEPEDYLPLISTLEESLDFEQGNDWFGLDIGDVKYNNPIVKIAISESGDIFPVFKNGFSLFPHSLSEKFQ